MRRRLGAGLVIGLMGAGIGVAFALQNAGEVSNPPRPAAPTAPPEGRGVANPLPSGGAAEGRGGTELAKGTTPMADREAVIGLLNKRNGISRDLKMKPGQSLRIGDVVVRLRACEQTAPWEPEKLTGAFVQVDVKNSRDRWGRVFSGWLYAESPSLNLVEHPIYDVWPKSCAMTFPDIGAETARLVSDEPGTTRRSRPRQSGGGAVEAAPAEAPSESAASSNST